jgi:hypothetical protein
MSSLLLQMRITKPITTHANAHVARYLTLGRRLVEVISGKCGGDRYLVSITYLIQERINMLFTKSFTFCCERRSGANAGLCRRA